MDSHSSEALPAVLGDLIAAGLVTHEVIGDPARLAGETATLGTICGLVGGTVYRLGAFHYAFRVGAEDLGGRMAGLAPGARTAALEAALRDALGEDAVWLNPPGPLAEGEAALDQPLMLLRAQEAAVSGALASASPGLRAVIDARYASDTARLTAGAAPGSEIAARLEAIEARQAEILRLLQARDTEGAAFEERLGLTIAEFLARLEAVLPAGEGGR